MNGLGFAFLLSLAGAAPSQIHVHYGFIPAGSRESTLRLFAADFEPQVKNLPAEVHWFRNSETVDLIASLQNPKVMGVFFINHPGVVHEKGRLLNSFLQTSGGAMVPKSIARAAHRNLRFFGLVSCHFTDLMHRYFVGSPFRVFSPTSLKIDDLPNDADRLLFEVSSIFAAPEIVLNDIRAAWEELSAGFTPEEPEPSVASLKVEYRDLLSAKFVYEVFADDRLIGVLDRAERKGEKTFPLGNAVPKVIRIRPDDALRARRQADPARLVDDILLDRVTLLQGERAMELLPQGIHLGDDSDQWDRETRTGLRVHDPDFAARPVQAEWSREVPQ